MKITNKFNIGDKVYKTKRYYDKEIECKECGSITRKYIYKPKRVTIESITALIDKKGYEIRYFYKKEDFYCAAEEDLFLTKEEAQKECDRLNKEE